jgi:TPR repeat protein
MTNRTGIWIKFQKFARFVRRSALLLMTWSSAAVAAEGQTAPAPTNCIAALPDTVLPNGGAVTNFKQAFSTWLAKKTDAGKGAAPNPGGESRPAIVLPDTRKALEHAAQRGDTQSQVNLAVASLAGWGAPPNAGAALYWFHAAADRGYPLASYDLGILYMNGCGVRQDYKEAFHFFEKGARGGDAAAQVNLGYLYDQGLGVARDRAAAMFWYRKAAETGVAVAQYNLADLYLRGDGVAQDDVRAFRWFQQAAMQGYARARVMLGSMYATGRGTRKDLAEAYMWLIASGMQTDLQCAAVLRLIEPQLSSAQITDAKRRATSAEIVRSWSDEFTHLR